MKSPSKQESFNDSSSSDQAKNSGIQQSADSSDSLFDSDRRSPHDGTDLSNDLPEQTKERGEQHGKEQSSKNNKDPSSDKDRSDIDKNNKFDKCDERLHKGVDHQATRFKMIGAAEQNIIGLGLVPFIVTLSEDKQGRLLADNLVFDGKVELPFNSTKLGQSPVLT